MPTPLNFGVSAQTALDNILQNALPVLLPAIMLLAVAITAVLLFLYLFGFKLGLGEKFKERLRRKKEARRGKFPIAIRRRATKETGLQEDAKSPWTAPADWSQTNQDMLFAVEQLDGDLAFFESMSPDFKLQDPLEFEYSDQGDEDEFTRLFYHHAKSVSDYWRQSFSHLSNINNLANATSVDDKTKRVIYMHAAKLSRMKQQALADDQSEWAKQYGDGMASRPVQFVA